jgi:hypothetical protein
VRVAASSNAVLPDCLFKTVSSLVCQMAIDDEEGVNHTRNPAQASEYDIQYRLNWFAAENDSQRGQYDCQKITHLNSFKLVTSSSSLAAKQADRGNPVNRPVARVVNTIAEE